MKTLIVNLTALAVMFVVVGCKKAEDPAGSNTVIPDAAALSGQMGTTPKADEPKADTPKADEPKADEPKADAPKVDEPKADEPKADEPKADEPKADAPKTE